MNKIDESFNSLCEILGEEWDQFNEVIVSIILV